jgi:hypothetical protein
MENLFVQLPEPLTMPQLERSEMMDTQSDKTDEHEWSLDVENQLKAIEQNSIQQAKIAKDYYLYLTFCQRYFQIPNIILSSMISVFSIGLNNYISQDSVSILNCILGFIVATMGSIQLYLGINKRLDVSHTSYQSYYLLSIKINNCLRLERDHRAELNGRAFLASCLNEYEQIFQQNNIIKDSFDDKLTNLELKIKR